MKAGLPRVVVASELPLVAETVRAGLVSHGFDVTVSPWPDDPPSGAVPVTAADHDVGLLISDLDRWPRLAAALLVMTRTALPWVVLTAAPHGPMWGAVLDAGARVVLTSGTGLTTVRTTVLEVARGSVQMPPAEREMLVGVWAELFRQRASIDARLRSLTPREREVLVMLHAGDPVARIAQSLGVSPATVRTQVKSVLRKLQVRTQLGAVAALDVLELNPAEALELQA